jgi:hypothetical protein
VLVVVDVRRVLVLVVVIVDELEDVLVGNPGNSVVVVVAPAPGAVVVGLTGRVDVVPTAITLVVLTADVTVVVVPVGGTMPPSWQASPHPALPGGSQVSP